MFGKKANQKPRMRDAQVQTSDCENQDEEMSAMERDIMLSTGCIPTRFRNKYGYSHSIVVSPTEKKKIFKRSDSINEKTNADNVKILFSHHANNYSSEK